MSVHCWQETEEPDDSVFAGNDASVDAGDLSADEAAVQIADNDADVCGVASAGMHSTRSACNVQLSEDAADSSGKDEESKADDVDLENVDDDDNDADDDDDDDDKETEADTTEDAVQL